MTATVSTPLVVTDQEALTLIGQCDAIVATCDAQFATLNNPTAAIAVAYATDRAAYESFATSAKADLQGGFFFGEWFGVPDVYNQAATWAQTLARHSADATAAGAAGGALPATPAPQGPTPSDVPWTAILTTVGVVGVAGAIAWAFRGAIVRHAVRALA